MAPEPGRRRPWRFPARYRVPDRRDLAAYALMTLAFGLMVGIAIGPALGAAGNAGQAIAGTLAPEPPAAGPAAAGPRFTLGPPSAGSVATGEAPDEPADPGPAPAPADPPAPAPASPSDPAEPDRFAADPEPDDPVADPAPEPGSPLSGVAVGALPSGEGYAVADSSGNLLAIHAEGAPAPGDRVALRIEPLANGTFAEVGGRRRVGAAARATVRGVVTWRDEAAGLLVLSARGASLALRLPVPADGPAGPGPAPGDRPEPVPAIGDQAEARARFAAEPAAGVGPAAEPPPGVGEDGPADPPPSPRLRADWIEVVAPGPSPLDLNGPVLAVDRAGRTVTIAADSFGETAGEVAAALPPGAAAGGALRVGRVYGLTAELGPGGGVELTGAWANGGRREAGRPPIFGP